MIHNILERATKFPDIKAVRIGHPARIAPAVVAFTLAVLCCQVDQKAGVTASVQEEIHQLTIRLRTNMDSSSERIEADATMDRLNRLLGNNRVSQKVINQVISKANAAFATLNGYINTFFLFILVAS